MTRNARASYAPELSCVVWSSPEAGPLAWEGLVSHPGGEEACFPATSFFAPLGPPTPRPQVGALLRKRGVDLDNNRFLILQVRVERKPRPPASRRREGRLFFRGGRRGGGGGVSLNSNVPRWVWLITFAVLVWVCRGFF